MRNLMFVIVAMAVSHATVLAQDSGSTQSDADGAIHRGLEFLVKDALQWKSDHQCASCHHAALIVLSMREAKSRKYSVNDQVLAELTNWMAESGEGKTSLPRPPNIPKALNTKAVFFGIALAAIPERDAVTETGLKRMLATIQGDQLENGSWAAWPETRAPMFGDSDENMTLLATLAVVLADSTDPSVQDVRDKALRWMHETKTTGDAQALALRLMIAKKAGRPDSEIRSLVDQIKQRQNADGGWSQTAEMTSDAWATGQALFALGTAGAKTSDDQVAIGRGRRFLVTNQRDDGSWPMTSRPAKPGGEGSISLVPIIGAGSAWAVLGLVGTSSST